MSEPDQNNDGYPQAGIRENVTATDYETALRNLRRFAELDLAEEIGSLEDLAFQMRFVGRGL